MKRDMNLIREILMTLEQSNNLSDLENKYGINDDVSEHLWLLEDANLVTH